MLNQIPWGTAAAIFLGTLPMLGVILWFTVDMARERKALLGKKRNR